jgi:hypothetical protein
MARPLKSNTQASNGLEWDWVAAGLECLIKPARQAFETVVAGSACGWPWKTSLLLCEHTMSSTAHHGIGCCREYHSIIVTRVSFVVIAWGSPWQSRQIVETFTLTSKARPKSIQNHRYALRKNGIQCSEFLAARSPILAFLRYHDCPS